MECTTKTDSGAYSKVVRFEDTKIRLFLNLGLIDFLALLIGAPVYQGSPNYSIRI